MPESQQPITSPFGHFTKASEVIKDINLSGKTAVVTGGHTGIGLHTTKALSLAGAHVVVLARDTKRAKRTLRGLENVTIEYFDLLLPDTIDAVANTILKNVNSVNILINSAGIIGIPLTRDSRGYEYQFAVNHLGHFQLTSRLFPALINSGKARVIAVSSRGHRAGGVIYDDVNFEHTEYNPMRAYAQSKSAIALFALELDRLGRKHGVQAFSVHPGPIPSSDLFAESLVGIRAVYKVEALRLGAKAMRGLHITEVLNTLMRPEVPNAFKTIEQGAATLVWCATSQELRNYGGVYCEDCNIAQAVPADNDAPFGVRPWATDPEAAKKLWRLSEEMIGATFSIS